MVRQGARLRIAAALLLCAAVLLAAPPPWARADTPATLLVGVGGAPSSQPIAPGFLGLSLEYRALHAYTGRDPGAVNPVLLALIRDLSPGQAPVLRIGGNSSDSTWWPQRGVVPPGGVSYGLTRGWLRTTRALASALGAQMILGVNLAAGRAGLAAEEARALIGGIGRARILALEIGNEPDLYSRLAWYRDGAGRPHYSRPRSYSIAGLTRDFSTWRAALPRAPIAGPSFANLAWMASTGRFLAAQPGLALLTAHRYPLRGCSVGPGSPSYPTVENLLSDFASTGLSQGIAPYVADAHAAGAQFRLGEMNSVACSGRQGVSDTFASALWMLDTLFAMASVGVDGVNVHTLPHAGYELFTFTHSDSGWKAFVRPDYYGMLTFAQAAPPGSTLLPVSGASGQLRVWATLGTDGTVRVVLINKDPAPHLVLLQPPGGGRVGSLQRLLAPSVDATGGVTLGGQSFGSETSTGVLTGAPQADSIQPVAGTYSITLPPSSAAMLTLG